MENLKRIGNNMENLKIEKEVKSIIQDNLGLKDFEILTANGSYKEPNKVHLSISRTFTFNFDELSVGTSKIITETIASRLSEIEENLKKSNIYKELEMENEELKDKINELTKYKEYYKMHYKLKNGRDMEK